MSDNATRLADTQAGGEASQATALGRLHSLFFWP